MHTACLSCGTKGPGFDPRLSHSRDVRNSGGYPARCLTLLGCARNGWTCVSILWLCERERELDLQLLCWCGSTWNCQSRSVFFFCVPSSYFWGSPFWVRFLRMWPFYNPTVGVVSFRLHGRSVLDTLCLLPGSKVTHKTHKGLPVAWK